MLKVKFYETTEIDDSLLRFAVILSGYQGKWVYCKHKNRNTWEVPGGHREENEAIADAARRELFEETGAKHFELIPVCVYSVKNETESYGMLFYADITELGDLPDSEIETIAFFSEAPAELTYPLIQPALTEKIKTNLCMK